MTRTSSDDAFLLHVQDMLAPWTPVNARKMFGGWGLYRGALMFGIIADDQLYFKLGINLKDCSLHEEWENLSYEKKTKDEKSKLIKLSYARVREEVLEDSDTLLQWAEAAWRDALANTSGKSSLKRLPSERISPPKRSR